MESKEKFEVIVEAWNGMITGSRYDAFSAFKEMKEGKNRYGEKTRYAVYSLEEKKC